MQQTATPTRTADPAGSRRRFARTLASARWPEYHELLSRARGRGYSVISLEQFVAEPSAESHPLLILRHDVDQHPRSALTMAAVEQRAGVRSTWYFRWRTADARVIERLRSDGFEVGLHYETLSRRLLETGRDARTIDDALIESCSRELYQEINAFQRRFGPIASVCPHGDTRIRGVHNGVLMQRPRRDGIGVIDCNEAMRGRGLAAWMSDRSTPDGGWGPGTDPVAVLAAGASPVLCLTHPNNWASGSGLMLDRLLGAVLPGRFPSIPIRTRRDRPTA